MRTVASLKDELAKFPDDALCYAYEGEVRGIVIMEKYRGEEEQLDRYEQGFIACSESDIYDETHPTILLGESR